MVEALVPVCKRCGQMYIDVGSLESHLVVAHLVSSSEAQKEARSPLTPTESGEVVARPAARPAPPVDLPAPRVMPRVELKKAAHGPDVQASVGTAGERSAGVGRAAIRSIEPKERESMEPCSYCGKTGGGHTSGCKRKHPCKHCQKRARQTPGAKCPRHGGTHSTGHASRASKKPKKPAAGARRPAAGGVPEPSEFFGVLKAIDTAILSQRARLDSMVKVREELARL